MIIYSFVMGHILQKLGICAAILANFFSIIFSISDAYACSRIVHTSDDGKFVATGRTMDWYEDTESNLWMFTRGIERNGNSGDSNSATWTSKYGSIITSGFDVATVDGINEKGLAANMLYLSESNFGKRNKKIKGISWAGFTQYLLDNYASVQDAITDLQINKVQIIASPIPGSSSKPPTLHFSISDPSGDSAVLEYIGGKLIIHHGKQYNVMTNSPTYHEQLAMLKYWKNITQHFIPGGKRSEDRYIRAHHQLHQLPSPKSARESIANVMSVMCNVSVPFGDVDPEKPNIAPTYWRVIADNSSRKYFFDSTLSPHTVWVDLKKIDFSQKAQSYKFQLVDNYTSAGDISQDFKPQAAFAFAGPQNTDK